MQRVIIELPSQKIFSCTIPIRITDINYGKHLGNDAVLSILHEARVQYLASFGCTELEVGGVSLVMADAMIEFKQQGFYGDVLHVQLFIGSINRAGFDLYYSLNTIRNNKDILITKAKTGMVCFDYTTQKVVSIPLKLKEQLRKQ